MKANTSFKFAAVSVALIAGAVQAQTVHQHQPVAVSPGPEYARVVSSTAIQSAVNVPKEVCGTETVTTPGKTSGAGAAMGAIAGGAMGNAVGKGSGRAVATMVGIVGGAILGDKVEGPATPQTHTAQRCITQNTTEYRTTGYNVVYEYAGKQYNVQLAQDPGQWLKVQVSPAAASAPATQPVAPLGMISAAPAPARVVHTTAVYPVYPMAVAPVVMPSVGYAYGRQGHRHYSGPTMAVNVGYGYPVRWY
jgi:uncharacterized protein YcfJ